MKRPSFFAALLLGLGTVLAVPARAAAPETLLAVDRAQSRIEIFVKATVDSFTGTLGDYQPVVRIDPATGRVVAAEVRFRFADVKTGKPERDEQMHTWQDTARHPDGKFVLRQLVPDDGTAGRHEAAGALILHGVSQEISFPVTITTDRHLYSIDGEATLDTRMFGLPIIRKFGVLKVDPSVRVRFHLQGRLPTT